MERTNVIYLVNNHAKDSFTVASLTYLTRIDDLLSALEGCAWCGGFGEVPPLAGMHPDSCPKCISVTKAWLPDTFELALGMLPSEQTVPLRPLFHCTVTGGPPSEVLDQTRHATLGAARTAAERSCLLFGLNIRKALVHVENGYTVDAAEFYARQAALPEE